MNTSVALARGGMGGESDVSLGAIEGRNEFNLLGVAIHRKKT